MHLAAAAGQDQNRFSIVAHGGAKQLARQAACRDLIRQLGRLRQTGKCRQFCRLALIDDRGCAGGTEKQLHWSRGAVRENWTEAALGNTEDANVWIVRGPDRGEVLAGRNRAPIEGKPQLERTPQRDRKSTRLNSSHI